MDSMVLLWVLFMAAIIVGGSALNIYWNRHKEIVPDFDFDRYIHNEDYYDECNQSGPM